MTPEQLSTFAESRMTPQQAKLVADSFKKVLPMAGVTADLFYDRLFEIAPETRSLFPHDLAAQKKKFITMLATVVSNLSEFKRIAPIVEDLGVRHATYGVVAKHYEPFGIALMEALEESLGVEFTPPVKSAWAGAYMTLADAMSPPKLAC
jgi:hemoglobin-like flavoprotein